MNTFRKMKRLLVLVLALSIALSGIATGSVFAMESSIGEASLSPALSPYHAVQKTITPGIHRISGKDRYATSIEIAKVLKTQLELKKFNAVIVTTGNNYADALSGSSLAAALGAPILLVGNGDNNKTLDYIQKNIDTKNGIVYILGGTRAVPASVENRLKAIMLDRKSVKRLQGDTRYDTNLSILSELDTLTTEDNPQDKSILICSGNSFADALSASAKGYPILLVDDKLNKNQTKYLKDHASSAEKIYLIGGDKAVSTSVQEAVDKIKTSERLSGKTRYNTSIAIAKKLFKNSKEAVMATGETYPDGLCGGVLAYTKDAPLLLTTVKSDAFRFAYQLIAKSNLIKSVTILGGDLVVSDDATGLTAKGGKKTGLLAIGDRYYFSDSSANLVKDIIKTINKKKYYFTAKTGVAAKSEIFKYKNKWYAAQANSTLGEKGWIQAGKLQYYVKDYNVHDVCIKAKAVLDKEGYNLRAAYNWSARLTFVRFQNSPYWGILWFADMGFSKGKGDCNVMASTFYIMAKMMGYSTTQVKGTVNIWYLPHSWVYIKHDDGTWIYDPNCLNETGVTTFKRKNDGTTQWTYHNDYIIMPLEYTPK